MRYDEVNLLNSLIKAIIKFNNRLYERVIKKQHNNSRRKTDTYTKNNQRDQGAISTFKNQGKPNNYYESMSMELDTTLRQ